MSKLIKIPSIFVLFALGGSVPGSAQESLSQCLFFEQGAEFITINMAVDSARTSFSIVRDGFATEKQRKQALEEYRHGPPTDERFPVFTFDFYSTSKPETIEAIEELHCLSLEEFRETNGNSMESILFFFQKNRNGSYLMWDDIAFWGYE